MGDPELDAWKGGTIPARLALRLRRELDNIEMEAGTEAQNEQDEAAGTYVWLIKVAEILHDELEKEARENPAELAGYLPRHVQVWANLGFMRKSDETG